MATKTEELIQNVQLEVTRIVAELDAMKHEVRAADLIQLRERLAKLDALLGLVNFTDLISRIATLEEQNVELKRWREESDRRRWQTQLLFFGSLLTLDIQLTVLFLKKLGVTQLTAKILIRHHRPMK